MVTAAGGGTGVGGVGAGVFTTPLLKPLPNPVLEVGEPNPVLNPVAAGVLKLLAVGWLFV
jgi:hypothetical protein